MKTCNGFLIGIFLIGCGVISLKGQDVYIIIPESNIYNRTEFNTIQNVLNTRNHQSWRIGFLAPIWPEIKSTSGNNFIHNTLAGAFLSTIVLEWQLKSIGGQNAPFRNQDTLPPYKSFSTNSQYWYQPNSTTGNYTPGDVSFNFKIPSNKFKDYTYHAGEYSINVTHNYGRSGFYTIEFTPDNFKVILKVPAFINWFSTTSTKYIEVSSLNDYRNVSGQITSDLANTEFGNTVDFNLWAKASSVNIQFVSSKGASGTRNISNIKLGSAGPELTTKSITNTSEKFSPTAFGVKTGNRNNFIPQLSISASDFKTNFFEAGTYTFQLNLEAKSTDNYISKLQNTDVTLKVRPLSEINIPNTGQTVDFNFNTSAQYANGQAKVVPKQLKISNNESFELYVKSDENYFKKGGVQTPINSNILQIGIDGNALTPLSTTAKKIITGGTPVLDKELDIKYEIPPDGAQTLVGYDKATYSINVYYSFTAI